MPGRPVIRQCPPAKRAIIIFSTTSSWPTITRLTCLTMLASASRKRAMRLFKSSDSICCVTNVDMIFLFSLIRLRQLQQHFLGSAISGRGFERG